MKQDNNTPASYLLPLLCVNLISVLESKRKQGTVTAVLVGLKKSICAPECLPPWVKKILLSIYKNLVFIAVVQIIFLDLVNRHNINVKFNLALSD